jgi:hypothetical protein
MWQRYRYSHNDVTALSLERTRCGIVIHSRRLSARTGAQAGQPEAR